MDKYESRHNKLGEKYAALVDAIYMQAILEFVQTAQLSDYDSESEDMFSFDDMPLTKALADKLTNTVASNIETTIINGCSASWNIANDKNDALVEKLFEGKTLTKEQKIRYLQNNQPALDAFIKRRTDGLNLSDRVWKYTDGYKNDIETALSVAIGSGKSAHEVAREVQKYLQQPDKLFRRVRDEKGELQLSQNAASYHPGQGVYRSSYQNAKRLARTEINMAYRTSDFTRIQQLDFIVGIEIKTSGNHPDHDICDQLQGIYPKDFKFTGWHPNCRCYQKTILKTEEEMEKDEERMRKGGQPLATSDNTVKDVPDNFKEWVSSNTERIENAKSLPYFIRDNEQYFNDSEFTQKAKKQFNEVERQLTKEERRALTLQKARERQAARTPEQIEEIKKEWTAREKKIRRKATLAKAEERHNARTEEEIARIKAEWAVHNDNIMHMATPNFGLSKYILTDNDIEVIKNIFDTNITIEKYNNSAIKGADILQLDKELSESARKYGIEFNKKELRFWSRGQAVITYLSKNCTLERRFSFDGNKKIAEHYMFDLGKDFQGKGFSKYVLQAFYNQYKRIDINEIKLTANLDMGGWCWARYGFCAINKSEVMSWFARVEDVAKYKGVYNELKKIIDDFYTYEAKDKYTPFPMNRISDNETYKIILEGSEWAGLLDMNNSEQVSIFETYLNKKKK